MKKKVLITMLTLIIAVSLGACGSPEVVDNAEVTESVSEETISEDDADTETVVETEAEETVSEDETLDLKEEVSASDNEVSEDAVSEEIIEEETENTEDKNDTNTETKEETIVETSAAETTPAPAATVLGAECVGTWVPFSDPCDFSYINISVNGDKLHVETSGEVNGDYGVGVEDFAYGEGTYGLYVLDAEFPYGDPEFGMMATYEFNLTNNSLYATDCAPKECLNQETLCFFNDYGCTCYYVRK